MLHDEQIGRSRDEGTHQPSCSVMQMVRFRPVHRDARGNHHEAGEQRPARHVVDVYPDQESKNYAHDKCERGAQPKWLESYSVLAGRMPVMVVMRAGRTFEHPDLGETVE